MKRWKVRQKVTKKNPGATVDAPFYLDDQTGSGSVQGRPASTNPGGPTQRRYTTRKKG